MELSGRVAIVTGGNGGLGQRICHHLARAGCRVAVTCARDLDGAAAVADSLRAAGAVAEAFACDVSDPGQVDALMDQVSRQLGSPGILVNDAAHNKWIPYPDLDALSLDDWNRILAVNLTGPMLCIKAVARAMRSAGEGRIVNIASVAGLAPTGSSIPYAVSKAGLIHLTRCMAVALAPQVLVNCVAPGYLEDTRATANLDPAYRQRSREGALLRRAAHKDDVADQVVALCRTDSITGQTLVVDAGRVFH